MRGPVCHQSTLPSWLGPDIIRAIERRPVLKKSKKMALTKETLRVLDEGTLADVEGGLTPIVLTTAAVVGYTIGKYTI